jgi:hypothetical protein
MTAELVGETRNAFRNIPFLGNSSWFTTMLCVSISYVVSSCTSRSVSYSERNSEMQTQTKVVFS